MARQTMQTKRDEGVVTEIGSEDSASKNSRSVSWLVMDLADTVLPEEAMSKETRASGAAERMADLASCCLRAEW